MALTCFVFRKRMICSEKRIILLLDLLPYGTRAVSPKYTIFSCGSCRVISRTTVSPPTPESNTPIGAFFFSHSILIIFSPRLQTILRFYTDTPELSSSWTMPDQYRNLHIFHPGIRLHGWIFLRTVSQLPVPPL